MITCLTLSAVCEHHYLYFRPFPLLLMLPSLTFGLLNYCTWPQPPKKNPQKNIMSVHTILQPPPKKPPNGFGVVLHLQVAEVGLKVSEVRQHLSAEGGEAAGLRRRGEPQVDARVGGAALRGAQLLPSGGRQDVIVRAALPRAAVALQH